jgi:hypothetical protein
MSPKRQRNSKGNKSNMAKEHGTVDVQVKDGITVIKESVKAKTDSVRVSWERAKGKFYPFDVDGAEEGDMIESAVTGTVVDAFLTDRVISHTILLNVDNNFIDGVKNFVKTAPSLEEHGFRWPFESGVARFTEKEFIGNEFSVVWDGRGFKASELTDVERRVPISADVIEAGCMVIVEYVVTCYPGRKSSPDKISFSPGCSLQLLSIGLLAEGGGNSLKINAARKKRRMAY